MAVSIMQGTTPALTININPDDCSLSNAVEVELYVLNEYECSTYTSDDLVIDQENNSITKLFTEEETARFTPGRAITVQGRLFFPDGIVGFRKIRIGVDDMIGVGADG